MEPLWPIVFAVGIYLALLIGLRLSLPDRPTLGSRWLHPGLMAFLLGALVVANLGYMTGRARWLRFRTRPESR